MGAFGADAGDTAFCQYIDDRAFTDVVAAKNDDMS